MKKILLFLLVCVNFIGVLGQDTAQGFVTYNVTRNEYTVSARTGKKVLYLSKKFNAVLYLKNNETLYKEITTEKVSDEASSAVSGNSVTYIPANKDTVQSIVYNNYRQNKIYYTFSTFSGMLGVFITDSIRPMQWEATTEEKIINNRRCTKYTLKSFYHANWTAWVDLSVAFPYGPWRMNNLPGLLVQLDSDNGGQSYTLQEISIGSKIAGETLYPAKELKSASVYTEAEYSKMEAAYKERLRLLFENTNVKVTDSDQ